MARDPDDSRVLSEVGFVHLHVHSSYSLLEGALMVGTLAKMAAADGQASAMEFTGQKPLLVPGEAQNFKVTYPDDFALAEAILESRT